MFFHRFRHMKWNIYQAGKSIYLSISVNPKAKEHIWSPQP